MLIQEQCIYNKNILCGGVVERLERGWRCAWNPTVINERKKQKSIVPLCTPEHRTWDKIDYKKVRSLYKSGLNDHEIADELNCSHMSVYRWREKYKLPPHRHHCRREEAADNEQIHVKRVDWTRCRQLYKKGLSDREIALKLGCGRSSVGRWRKKHRLPPNFQR